MSNDIECKADKTNLIYQSDTTLTKIITDVFNNFEVDSEEKKYFRNWLDKGRYINSGDCAEFAYKVLKRLKEEGKKNNDIKDYLFNAHVVILQHVHCFLVINNAIYCAENPFGINITNRTVIDKYVAKWILDLDNTDKYIVQYKTELYSGSRYELEKTGYEVFRVKEDVTQEEQEEVWMTANHFIDVYENKNGLDEFSDCSYYPYNQDDE